MRILFFGDVVGKPGQKALAKRMGALSRQHNADVTIVNGENAAGGFGITPQICKELFDLGADVITLGNHSWDKREIATYIDEEPRLIRPLNYPPGTPGMGSTVVRRKGKPLMAVVQAHGRVFSNILFDDPFRALEAEVERLRQITPVILVDFHGEATSEKAAAGWFLDGKVSALVGTHTHIQTADEQLLLRGTAYISDVGMCGPFQGVIGTDRHLVLERFLTQMPTRFEPADGPTVLCAVVIEVDPATGRALSIERIQERE